MSEFGTKLALPPGTERVVMDEYEAFYVHPPARPNIARSTVSVLHALSPFCQRAFSRSTVFNPMPTIVCPAAFTTENLLICAPTGAVGLLL